MKILPFLVPVIMFGMVFTYLHLLRSGALIRVTREQADFAGDVLMDIDELTRKR